MFITVADLQVALKHIYTEAILHPEAFFDDVGAMSASDNAREMTLEIISIIEEMNR